MRDAEAGGTAEERPEKKKKRRGRAAAVLLCVLLGIAALDFGLTAWIYDQNFNQRFATYGPLRLREEDYPDLEVTEYSFPSDKGQMLAGSLFRCGRDQRGIVILAHGFGGGGFNSYMDVADYFAEHGYYVFGYDATGCDGSEGEGVGGMPQGVIDLDYAIRFVENCGDIPDLPIVLFGHSWGGYCVLSVLSWHPEVQAVIECCGFNRSSDMFEVQGKKQAGEGIYAMLPFCRLYEWMKFGKYASGTAMDGIEQAKDTAILCLSSDDDEMVPLEYGYQKFYDAYKDDPRFTFILLHGRGHSYVYNDQAYMNEFNAGFDEWVRTLDYDPEAQENQERFIADKADYITAHLDHARWSHTLDQQLFSRFLDFFDSHLAEK